MTRISIIILICIVVFVHFGLYDTAFAIAPNNSAQAATVIDVASGRILYDKNGNQKLPIASLTKIMTAIVAIEAEDLQTEVVASKNAVGVEGSSIYLRQGEKLTLENLLYGLMLRSGNDAAVAIAEHIGGSVEGFAYLMNEKAQYIGLKNSNFVNPHGLDHKSHYSTANDLAILTAYALQNPIFQEIVSTKIRTAPLEGYKWDRKWFNKNKMLRNYAGADGVKTGYTKIAKRCLVSSATRDGRQVVVVVINDGNDWVDSANLLDYGFNQFKNVEVVRNEQIFEYQDLKTQKIITLKTTRNSVYPIKSEEFSAISTKVQLTEQFKNNGVKAYLNVYLYNSIIDRIPLITVGGNNEVMNTEISIPSEKLFWESWASFWRYVI